MTSARAAARAAKPALESHRKQTYTVGKRKLNVIAPSTASGADEDMRAAPPCDLELAHVYGYNGRRSRNNAFYLGDGNECVYNIARLCVVLGTRVSAYVVGLNRSIVQNDRNHIAASHLIFTEIENMKSRSACALRFHFFLIRDQIV